jgi:hypothetical protein
MSKQNIRSQGTRQGSFEINQNTKPSPDPQDQARNPADREYDEPGHEGGGEESKHGRKQKGNVDDS